MRAPAPGTQPARRARRARSPVARFPHASPACPLQSRGRARAASSQRAQRRARDGEEHERHDRHLPVPVDPRAQRPHHADREQRAVERAALPARAAGEPDEDGAERARAAAPARRSPARPSPADRGCARRSRTRSAVGPGPTASDTSPPRTRAAARPRSRSARPATDRCARRWTDRSAARAGRRCCVLVLAPLMNRLQSCATL